MFENGRGFALAENVNAPDPFVTWQFSEENGGRDYYWGHYTGTLESAERDFELRVTEYQTRYGVVIQSTYPKTELYNYYSTQRPVDIGTYPKEGNTPISIVNFNERLLVENCTFRAWGIITYEKPLTEKQTDDYELRASRCNGNVKREAKLSISAQLKDAAAMAKNANAALSAPEKNTDKER